MSDRVEEDNRLAPAYLQMEATHNLPIIVSVWSWHERQWVPTESTNTEVSSMSMDSTIRRSSLQQLPTWHMVGPFDFIHLTMAFKSSSRFRSLGLRFADILEHIFTSPKHWNISISGASVNPDEITKAFVV